MSEQPLPQDLSPEAVAANVAEISLDPVAEGAAAAQRLIDGSNSALAVSFSHAHEGPYAPDERRERPAYQVPDEVRARDAEINDLTGENSNLKKLLEVDPLTGLKNKQAFLKAANEKLAAAESEAVFGMLFIDLKDFKALNDNHPELHDKGDSVLKDIGKVLRESIRQHHDGADVIAHGSREDDSGSARLGGDEFAIFADMSETESSDPVEVRLKKFQARLQGIFDAYMAANPDLKQSGFGGISIGAVLNQPGETAESMLARADALMKVHKDEQRLESGSYR